MYCVNEVWGQLGIGDGGGGKMCVANTGGGGEMVEALDGMGLVSGRIVFRMGFVVSAASSRLGGGSLAR